MFSVFSPRQNLQSHFRNLETAYISGKYVQLFFVNATIVFLYFGIIFVWFLSVTAYVQHAIQQKQGRSNRQVLRDRGLASIFQIHKVEAT